LRSCTRRRTPFACSLLLVLALAAPRLVAQAPQQDEAVVSLLARLLALSDARQFDDALLRQALQNDNYNVRFQGVLAAGRIGDPQAVELLVPVLSDSSTAVQTAAAFALGVLADARAVEPLLGIVRSVAPAAQGAREIEAVTALAKIGGEEGAQAVRLVLESAPLGQSVPPIVMSGLLEAWRLGARAPTQLLLNYAEHPDETVRWRALYSLARLRSVAAQPVMLRALGDPSTEVRAVAARGLSATLADSGRIGRGAVAARLRPLVNDDHVGVRINALRALASFRGDSTLAAAAIAALSDANPGVVAQAETTLGVLGGSAAVEALRRQSGSATFGLRRQAIIGLAEADSAAGNAIATTLAGDPDWLWRVVAAQAFTATRDRARLEDLLADPDGRVVAQALQGLARVVADSDGVLIGRARTLVEHADPAVRSVAADLLARRPDPGDVDRLVAAYRRAATDPFNDARLSAVGALAAIAAGSAGGRLRVVNEFLGTQPRPDDYLVRRFAMEKLPEAAEAWAFGGGAPISTGKSDADYRDVVRRYLLPALLGQPNPQVAIETDRGTLTIDLLPAQAPLTVAAFLALVDRRYFDGQRWHRVVPNFVVQAGDPRGDGWGGPGTVLRDEINLERYAGGTMGMALSGADTGGSQFFITQSTQPHLDGTYTVFGRLRSDARLLQQIAQGDRIRSIHR
jgi:cyclophilin family peptidyl-prolyl cis-trans isomerase/HEAT repeat protein